jgi:hypothetical protein
MAFGQGFSPGGGGGQPNYSVFDAQKEKDEGEVKTLLRQMERLNVQDQLQERKNNSLLLEADTRQSNILTEGKDYRQMSGLLDHIAEGGKLDDPLGPQGERVLNFNPDKYKEEFAKYAAKDMLTGQQKNKLASSTVFSQMWDKNRAEEASEILANLMDEKEVRRLSDKEFNLMLRDNPHFRKWFRGLKGPADSGINEIKAAFMDKVTGAGYDPNYRTTWEGAQDWVEENPLKTATAAGVTGGMSYKMRSVLSQAKLLEGKVATAQKSLDYLTTRPINELTGKPFEKGTETYNKWMRKRGQRITANPERTGLKSIERAETALKNAKKLSEPYGKWTKKLAKSAPGMLPYFAPSIGSAMGGLHSEEGALAGRGLGAAYMLKNAIIPAIRPALERGVKGSGTMVKQSFARFLKKRLPGLGAKAAARIGVGAVIDGPLPIGELVGAVFAAGYGAIEIIGLYKEWKRLTK